METNPYMPKSVVGKVRRRLRFMVFYLVHRLSLKKKFLCESCYKIHKMEESTIELNDRIGMFVSQECAHKVIEEAHKILRERIFSPKLL